MRITEFGNRTQDFRIRDGDFQDAIQGIRGLASIEFDHDQNAPAGLLLNHAAIELERLRRLRAEGGDHGKN